MQGLKRQSGDLGLASGAKDGFARWEPWGEFDHVLKQMETLFGRHPGAGAPWTQGRTAYAPPVDLYETTGAFILNAYLPGLSREDIHVEVIGGAIRLWGESKSNLPETGATVLLSQGSAGSFEFRIKLPAEVQPEATSAVYRNGVLEVHLPKLEVVKPRAVEIQIGG